jgi:hypothetical protein
MKQYLTTWMSLMLILTLTGCGGRGNSDLLEARLREQEDSIFALQRDLKDSQQALQSAREQSAAMQKQLAKSSNGGLLPEQSKTLFRVTGVKVNSLLTGGVDLDSKPGDELWTTVITPHDVDGETVKLPADLELELVDLNQPEDQRRVGVWKFSSQEVRSRWYSGFAGSGFRFELPWQSAPASEELTLLVRMKSQDGRTFQTTAPLKVARLENSSQIQTVAREQPAFQKPAVSREQLTPAEPARISFDQQPEMVTEEGENPFRQVSAESAPPAAEPDFDSPFRAIQE